MQLCGTGSNSKVSLSLSLHGLHYSFRIAMLKPQAHLSIALNIFSFPEGSSILCIEYLRGVIQVSWDMFVGYYVRNGCTFVGS